MIVLNTGAEGHPFSARLPFSWEITHLVQEVLHAHINEDEGNICISFSVVLDKISFNYEIFIVHWYSIYLFLCFFHNFLNVITMTTVY